MTGEAVVIGAGPNGLAAAIRLAENGVAVTVLEAGDAIGGAVRTEELTLPGFRHDTFSSVYPAAVASPVFARMPLAAHGLEWVHPGVCMAHPLPDGTALALRRDLNATARGLDHRHAGDGQRWAGFAGPYLDAFPALRDMMLGGFPPVGGALALVGRAGPRPALGFTRLLAGSAVRLGRRLFEDDGARAWLYGAAMHGDAPPGAPGSGVSGFYLNLLGHAVGWPSPRGGAARLIDALAAHLTSLGGTIVTGARVERIIAASGRVTGVGVAGGAEHPAAVVVADVMPVALAAMAGAALAAWYRAALRRYAYGPATVKLDWALDGPIPWLAPEAREAGTVHVGGGEADMLASLQQAERGLPDRPFLLLGQQSIADPTRAPAGRHTAWASTWRPWSSRLSGSPPASTSASWPGMCWARPRWRRATPTWSAATSGAAATGCARRSSARCPSSLRTPRPCADCSSAARRPSQAAPSTGCRATPPPAPRSGDCAATAAPDRRPRGHLGARRPGSPAEHRVHLGRRRQRRLRACP
jgi:phytoene dehydrogenase-like protein